MKFLLDTNVISELRKANTQKINPHVKAWAESVVPSQLFLDALIAATALVHNMTVVTRNVIDFEATGVKMLNPWEFSL